MFFTGQHCALEFPRGGDTEENKNPSAKCKQRKCVGSNVALGLNRVQRLDLLYVLIYIRSSLFFCGTKSPEPLHTMEQREAWKTRGSKNLPHTTTHALHFMRMC